MSKVDYSRDYYADLELSPTADVNEVKKQFRKLALKYHPDRNPGKETEVNAKFQTIQAAHEILSNVEQKTKYDAHRIRKPASRYPTSSGVRGNPWQDVSSQYPVPPRRPGAAPGRTHNPSASTSRPTAASSASTSAHRYSSFNPPPPPPTTKTSRENFETRYKAWQNMRPVPKPPKATPSASAAYAAGASAASNATGTTSSMPPPPPPRTAAQKHKADASFGSRRNTGFFPRSPLGDEPPAANTSNYYTSRMHKASADEPYTTAGRPVTPPDDRDRHAPHSSHANKSEESFFDVRQSTPYQTHGGEKFNPFDGVPLPDLSRTKSQSGFSGREHRPMPRRRSSSFPDESDKPKVDTTAGIGTGDKEAQPDAGVRTRSRTRTATGLRHKFGNNSSSTPMPQFEEHYRRRQEEEADGETETPGKDKPIFSRFSFDAESFPASPSTPGGAPGTPVTPGSANRFMRNSAENINTRFVAEEQAKTDAPWQFNAGGVDGGTAEANGFSPRVRRTQSSSRLGRRQSPGKDRIPLNGGGPPRPPRPPYVATDSSEKVPQSEAQPQPQPQPQPTQQQPDSTAEAGSGFDAEKWTEKIGSEHFVPVPPRKATPTQFASRPIKKPRPTRTATRTAFVVDESEDSSSSTTVDGQSQPTPPDTSAAPSGGNEFPESPGAMDIDSPAPTAAPEQPVAPETETAGPAETDGAETTETNGPRNIPVEPSRPEWRAGDGKAGVAGAAGAAVPETNRPANGSVPVTGAVGGSEDSEEFIASLADMKNVEPLAEHKVGAAGSGLGSLGDLRSNLPFESKAAAGGVAAAAAADADSTGSAERKKHITFPKAPMPPPPPAALAVPGLQPTASTWGTYVKAFRQYVEAWTAFNNQFVDHFVARRSEVERKRQFSKGFEWLETMGDAGIDEYLDWASQDNEVRMVWLEASAGHEQAMRQFKVFRERMKG